MPHASMGHMLEAVANEPKQTIHDQARELTDMAFIYGEDGAFYSAAARLRAAANLYETRARETDPKYADCKMVHGGQTCEGTRCECWQNAEAN